MDVFGHGAHTARWSTTNTKNEGLLFVNHASSLMLAVGVGSFVRHGRERLVLHIFRLLKKIERSEYVAIILDI